ncbi:MAG: VWA domain-containing protein, partial [Planctomycetota bacterium]|nr:VWA domain-containing protein [Planctomycetota bacterium]
ASAAAAALAGSGIDLLTCPAVLGPATDVHLAALKVPDAGHVGRDVPIEVTVASQSPCTVRVSVWRWSHAGEAIPVDFRTVTLAAEPGRPGAELRKVVRVVDRPAAPGVAVYTARVSGPDGELPNDISVNNSLAAATWITGPSRWAVLARPGSTLAALCADAGRPLGVAADVFAPGLPPQRAGIYDPYAGIMVDGLSAAELPEGPALNALADAVGNGKALLAFGGERAFGAGNHRAGTWERLLPVEMTPEDDRTRSVLFVIDVSKSMDERMRKDGGIGVRKIDFAAEQLALAVQKLKPLDRLGLISFSGSAQVAAPLSSDPSRSAFLAAVKNVAIQSNTDLLPPLKKAQEVLQADDAEEQLVVMLSDGVQTAATPIEEVIQAAKTLCPPSRDPEKPRRRMLFTFGIGVDAKDANATGEKLLKTLAETGGGAYSPEFLKLAERLEKAFESGKKDFYIRREPFVLRPSCEHPILTALAANDTGTIAWPALPFRNRVKAKPGGEVLLWSAAASPAVPLPEGGKGAQRPDPIVTLSGALWPGVSRRAALAVSLDGAAGTAWFGSPACRKLLPALVEWTEAKTGAARPGWMVDADAGDDETIAVVVRARDPVSGEPLNGRRLQVTLTALQLSNSTGVPPAPADGHERDARSAAPLHPSAPGMYRALLPKPAQGVYRLSIETVLSTALPGEEDREIRNPKSPIRNQNVPICERFLTVPYPAEVRRFGTDRAAMQALVAKAGGNSRVIENPQDLSRWAADKAASRETYSLRPWLIAAGLALLLAEYALRGRRT